MKKAKHQDTDEEKTIKGFASYSDADLEFVLKKLTEEIAQIREPILTLFKEACKLIQLRHMVGSEIARRGKTVHEKENDPPPTISDAIAFSQRLKEGG